MPIEINEMVVNAILDEDADATSERYQGAHRDPDLEELKAQIISECRDLFYNLMDKEGDR